MKVEDIIIGNIYVADGKPYHGNQRLEVKVLNNNAKGENQSTQYVEVIVTTTPSGGLYSLSVGQRIIYSINAFAYYFSPKE